MKQEAFIRTELASTKSSSVAVSLEAEFFVSIGRVELRLSLEEVNELRGAMDRALLPWHGSTTSIAVRPILRVLPSALGENKAKA